MSAKPKLPYRAIIEHVRPCIDGGRFPIKRVPGELVDVVADVFGDGHDILRAVVRYRGPNEAGDPFGAWGETAMEPGPNDVWCSEFTVDRVGTWDYVVEAWVDHFRSWRRDLDKKFHAKQAVNSELLEGAMFLRSTAARERDGVPPRVREWLLARAEVLASDLDEASRVEAALDPVLLDRMDRFGDRPAAVSSPVLKILVEPVRARFGAWYEMFPRSASSDPTRSATFAEAATRLPAIAAMGFDVLYLPPVHPIGRTHRKGLNNTLTAGPGDPGSPWAIGGPEGGHVAVEPGLGTLQDFERFVDKARSLGLEIALDLAFQCSPDHPYVKEHPEWFRHRPDGTIKYAENPPKKYQDIYPFDFESAHWASLWDELKRVILFWIDRGVRIFRVDNPHTKALRFWEWVITEVRRERPGGVIFLSEAFTRPKVMKHLAKLGFSQSYTYFTWRNTKWELTEYFTELTHTEVREYMRPNLFANTPDILHEYLQAGGRPAFEVRLVLAATLGASYGIYSGYELCENRAVPGTEEYMDSEKYQFRQWDWHRPGNIIPLVTHVNAIRRQHAALHNDRSLLFHETDNPNIICYSKESPDESSRVLVIVNLNPLQAQQGWVKAPAVVWGLPPEGYTVEDLLTGEQWHWRGEWNWVRLEPAVRCAHVMRLPGKPGVPRPMAEEPTLAMVSDDTLDSLTT